MDYRRGFGEQWRPLRLALVPLAALGSLDGLAWGGSDVSSPVVDPLNDYHHEPATSSTAPADANSKDADLEVHLSGLGNVQGHWNKGVREFLGIPFAAPPTRHRRWLPPFPAKSWGNQTLMAVEVSPGCRRPSTWYTLNPKQSEDCLYLNLWSPPSSETKGRLVPVMVWVFGGGFYTGSGDSLQTRGDQLVRTFGDVIVVTFNYRLGVLGFLGSESLRRYTYERTGLNTTGNMGFLDQVEALKFVRNHARSFGGDPERVMLFGESAGSAAVAGHLTSPWSAGLFHSAAMQSGGFSVWGAMTMHHAEDNFQAMAASMKELTSNYNRSWAYRYQCKDSSSDVDCLTKTRLSGKHLVNIADGIEYWYDKRATDWDGLTDCQWGPISDGVVLQDHPFHLLAEGSWHPVPVIIGLNRDEGTEFIDVCRNGQNGDGSPSCNVSSKLYDSLYSFFQTGKGINDPKCFQDSLYKRWMALLWGPSNVESLFAVYNSTPGIGAFSTNFWAAEQAVTDYLAACTERWATKTLAQKGPVWEYEFARAPILEPFGHPPHQGVTSGFGACHGCEIPFVFNRKDSTEFGIIGDGELELGLEMSTYWTNLAWSGNPNEPGERWSKGLATRSPKWPPRNQTSSASRSLLLFNATDDASISHVIEHDVRGDRCEAVWFPMFRRSGWLPPKEKHFPSSERWADRPMLQGIGRGRHGRHSLQTSADPSDLELNRLVCGKSEVDGVASGSELGDEVAVLV